MKRIDLTSKEVEKFWVRKGDLLFARRSLVAEGAGKCSIVDQDGEKRVFESSIIRARWALRSITLNLTSIFFRSQIGLHQLYIIRRQVAAAGLNKPDISILSDQFLAEVKDMPQKDLAFEMLKKLLNDQIRIRLRKNIVQQRSFLDLLEKAIKAYTNKSIETAEIIQELIDLAKKIREDQNRGKDLGLNEDEIAFYDALADNESAKEVLGDKTLRTIARELVITVKKNITIDWSVRENVQAKLRVIVKKILRKYGNPPDKQEKATITVLEQAKLLGYEWVS